MRNYLFNGYRRISGELVFFAIPFAMGVSRDVLKLNFFGKTVNFNLQDTRYILGQRITMNIRTAKPDILPRVHITEQTFLLGKA